MDNSFQLVIPASGIGARFKESGYKETKPMIMPNGISMIENVLSMYPGIRNPVVILNNSDNYLSEIYSVVRKIAPLAQFIEIEPHKFGPSYAIWAAKEHINPKMKTIVNYIDFYACWNPELMLKQLETSAGSILTYSGFHPHMLRSTKFAYIKTNRNQSVIDIKEKSSFTDLPTEEEASAGAYGFSNGQLLIDAVEYQIANNLVVNGEYYLSLSYKYLIDQNLEINYLQADHFFQWGTPQDLLDWTNVYKLFKRALSNQKEVDSELRGSGIILAAGEGSRIINLTNIAKPITNIFTKKLWTYSLSAIKNLKIQILAKNKLFELDSKIKELKIINFEKVTRGQAETSYVTLNNYKELLENPISLLSCDNIIFEESIRKAHSEGLDFDLLVWVKRNYLPAYNSPESYSWVEVKENLVSNVYFKTIPNQIKENLTIVGNFTFNNLDTALKYLSKYIQSRETDNSELYLDKIIEIMLQDNAKVKILELEEFFSIGCETELKILNYWKNCDNFIKMVNTQDGTNDLRKT